MKVLHVLRHLNPGGIECWLDRLLRRWPAENRPEFHFALELAEKGSLADGLKALGAYMHHVPTPSDVRGSTRAWKRLLAEAGPFDVVHSHIHHASVIPLAWAKAAGVPVRIAHSHADLRCRPASILRQSYFSMARKLLPCFASRRIAVSRQAACDLFGEESSATDLFPCGSDLEPLLAIEREGQPGRFTVAHVGRFVPEKNHEFVLKVFAGLYRQDPCARLLLVGDGPLREQMESLAVHLGIGSVTEFAGSTLQVPHLLARADLFLFPSISEGLGLAAIEAQAAGLPVVMADHLPPELDLFPSHIRRLALQLPVELWMNAIREMRSLPSLSTAARRSKLECSLFTIDSNISKLQEIYAS